MENLMLERLSNGFNTLVTLGTVVDDGEASPVQDFQMQTNRCTTTSDPSGIPVKQKGNLAANASKSKVG